MRLGIWFFSKYIHNWGLNNHFKNITGIWTFVSLLSAWLNPRSLWMLNILGKLSAVSKCWGWRGWGGWRWWQLNIFFIRDHLKTQKHREVGMTNCHVTTFCHLVKPPPLSPFLGHNYNPSRTSYPCSCDHLKNIYR